jgi:hypothetical protein
VTSKGIDCGRSGAKYCRERQASPRKFDRRSFRTKPIGKIRIVVGCPKGKWSPARQRETGKGCKVGLRIQTILRPKSSPKCKSACRMRG